MKSQRKKNRQEKLLKLIEQNPLATDEQLAGILSASISTIRLDRAVLAVPELRERM
ncbi:MAG: transcription factor FapR, partial [Synergistetes bacterium HGW-Synergistetes-2]